MLILGLRKLKIYSPRTHSLTSLSLKPRAKTVLHPGLALLISKLVQCHSNCVIASWGSALGFKMSNQINSKSLTQPLELPTPQLRAFSPKPFTYYQCLSIDFIARIFLSTFQHSYQGLIPSYLLMPKE